MRISAMYVCKLANILNCQPAKQSYWPDKSHSYDDQVNSLQEKNNSYSIGVKILIVGCNIIAEAPSNNLQGWHQLVRPLAIIYKKYCSVQKKWSSHGQSGQSGRSTCSFSLTTSTFQSYYVRILYRHQVQGHTRQSMQMSIATRAQCTLCTAEYHPLPNSPECQDRELTTLRRYGMIM